ncbi:MAG: type I DNA topoisomerase [Deltaproteobacteria bacterium]|nr:type I DNA topoisomerase [Deltaproteobacteria bacterium]
MSAKPLVIVESPTKVRTIKKYLGKGYNVAATVGHIKDLPQKELGIDIEDGFKPQYMVVPGKKKVIAALKKAAGNAEEIYLAPDPDREGEAIAWHTAEVLKKKGRKFYRVLFHELTKKVILEAIHKPEELNQNKYEAQKTRRILDRLVGYQISPLLWRKVKGGLSAGRVQSVALRIICEREKAIQAFEPQEYWSIIAHLEGDAPPVFEAKLVKKDAKQISIPNQEDARKIVDDLNRVDFRVDKIVRRTKKRNPQPPFITSKLQQESIQKLRFSAKKTMTLAQQLYEGIDLNAGEPVGLITYMRTDSTRISAEAAQEALQLIRQRFGPEYCLDKPRSFKNRKKAQDAHEAIRPTSVELTPEKVAPFLSENQLALYRLIWNRFVASQMTQALIDQNTISVAAGPYLLTATGSSVKFPGFMVLYLSVADQREKENDQKKGRLPELSEGALLQLHKLDPRQHFTKPPPRFSEASLVKELEENGIGRPSTYTAILSTIRQKGYVDLVKRYFRPSELGFLVNELLVGSFSDLFNVDFTARMEDYLDQIESAELNAKDILKQYYDQLQEDLKKAKEKMPSLKRDGLPTGLDCPDCSKELYLKVGKNGHFLACSGYPECRYSRDYIRDEKGKIQPVEIPEDEVSDKTCEKCGQPMVIKQGRYGKFMACSGYPECKNTYSVNAVAPGKDTGVACPEPGCSGKLIEKQSKRGKIFYGCNLFPECSFATWDKPVDEKCPLCGAPFLIEKTTKRDGTFYACRQKECGYRKEQI